MPSTVLGLPVGKVDGIVVGVRLAVGLAVIAADVVIVRTPLGRTLSALGVDDGAAFSNALTTRNGIEVSSITRLGPMVGRRVGETVGGSDREHDGMKNRP